METEQTPMQPSVTRSLSGAYNFLQLGAEKQNAAMEAVKSQRRAGMTRVDAQASPGNGPVVDLARTPTSRSLSEIEMDSSYYGFRLAGKYV